MQRYILSLLLLCGLGSLAQVPCDKTLKSDSVILSAFTKKEPVELMEAIIKNNYQVQFIKQGNKTFLKIIVRDNLGFGQIGELMLICSKKQIYEKSARLVPIDKTSAYFVMELNPNYIQTIAEFGLTKFIFRDTVEFLIPKSDSDKVKMTAGCFFDAVIPK